MHRMLAKPLLLLPLLAGLSTGSAHALELNTATQRQLEQLDGIGATMARRIVEERRRDGDFRHWDDLRQRVRGISQDKAGQWSDQGLTVAGEFHPRVFVARVPVAPAAPPERPKEVSLRRKKPASSVD